MITVTIKCPKNWYKQCDWIYANCRNYKDKTCWSEWQIGYDDIYFELEDNDAVMFMLRWS